MLVESWLLALGAYLLGSVPFGYLLGRLARGIDIQCYGSGNVGGSNVWATVGRRYGAFTSALDIAKGVVPVVVAHALGMGQSVQGVVGVAAVAGHNWSVYLRLSGGRGLGTGLGVLLALAPGLTTAFVGIGLVLFALLRNPPLTSGAATVFLPLLSILLGEPQAITLTCIGLAAVVLVKRVGGNPGTAAVAQPWARRLLYRLLFDRDVPGRRQWVFRRPPQDETRRGSGR